MPSGELYGRNHGGPFPHGGRERVRIGSVNLSGTTDLVTDGYSQPLC